jgi:methylmalonyl-CoA mutase
MTSDMNVPAWEDRLGLSRLLSAALARGPVPDGPPEVPVLGITGPGGSGKSSLCDELIRRLLLDFPELRVGVLAIDPTRKRTGGALLGDRLRCNSGGD